MNTLITPLLKVKSSFVLFIAPPGWGKTTMLTDLYKKTIPKMIFVSPLRALANEFFEKTRKLGNVFLIKSKSERDEIIKQFFKKNHALLVATPETLDQFFILELEAMKEPTLIVLDEFHLYYYWGQSFRPVLWEVCMGLTNSNNPILGLTATMEQKILDQWKHDFSLASENQILINLGNQELINLPDKYYYFPDMFGYGRKALGRRFLYELGKNQSQTFLFFCKYREEVDRWLELCQRKKIIAIGCKGGEVDIFLQNLAKNPRPRCIFTTSALSHGVNLPPISKVFISYKVFEFDFLIQMTGRGGRTGKNYQLYTLNQNIILGPKAFFLLVNMIKVLFMDLYFKARKNVGMH